MYSFFRFLTAGYLLKMPQDFYLRHNVDEKKENGEIIKYPVLSYIADIRHFEKVYRNILENMKEFFKKHPEALK